MLPDGDGRVVPNNSQDVTSSERVTQVGGVIFLCVSRYSICFVLRFSAIFKLCELVLTIPATSAADERSFSSLKRLKKLFKKFAEPG
jgi:hypothetical protein